MNRIPSPIENEQSDFGAAEIRANLQKIERRDLWVWGNAIVIIIALAVAIFSLSSYLVGNKTFLGVDESLAVRILVTLVLVFTGQIIYQHLSFRRLQRELAEQQIQAEVFRRLAMFDPLTGLYNRRFAEQRLKAEIARSERKGHPLIVVLIDLNDFKQINDTYGHQAGDTVLKEFAKRLNRATRGSDLAARWGGDEFMMLLVDCEQDQLHNILERLDSFSIEAHGRELPVAHAVGWKSYERGDNMTELIEAADRMLYTNKGASKKNDSASPAQPELASRLL
ncbi:MAG TPA: GGDEF domain-containing protein [Candidatus Acidoferrum sp.]|nr:GGDEF domain-containing protein [Candidatus Acidoferrum sp.]